MIKKFSMNFSQLVRKAEVSENGIYRECFHHSPASEMQFMLIAFKPHKKFNFIRDSHKGNMAFTCLYGNIHITTMNGEQNINAKNKYSLRQGDILYLPRNYWRMTETDAGGAVFTESIEGQFEPSLRDLYDEIS